MLARRLLPLALLALVGCIPTSGKKCGSCDIAPAVEETTPATTEETGCCSKCAKADADSCCAEGGAAVAKVELKAVKMAGLDEAIASHKGKVVVLDLWANSCVPCKKEFPHLVELHGKMAGQGVVCLSVSVDDAAAHDRALAFLTSSKATFGNYRLDEPYTAWQEKWQLNGIPAVLVFGRDGQLAGKFSHDDSDNPFEYERDVFPLVSRLAAAK